MTESRFRGMQVREDFLKEVTCCLRSRDLKDNLGISQRRRELGPAWQIDTAVVLTLT